MLRIGETLIIVPVGVDVVIDDPLVTVKGRKGELSHTIPTPITVALEEGRILVSRPDGECASRFLHDLTRTFIANMIVDVAESYKKSPGVTGTGHRTVAKGKNLESALGFSYPVIIGPAEGIEFTTESQTKFTVHGIDKQFVGETAAHIRKLKKPESYKGRGIHYVGETIRRKIGKAGK